MGLAVAGMALGVGVLLSGSAAAQPAACGANLRIDRSLQLEPGCRYTGSTVITGSNLVLDCQGATLDGDYKVVPVLRVGGDKMVSDVEIRNCVITGSRGSAVIIGLSAPDSRKPLGVDGRPDPAQHPHRITLRDVTVARNGGVGIFVDDYVQDTSILNSTVEDNAAVGIYLEHNSRRSRIANTRVARNGFGRNSGIPAASNTSREGIAVDASADNIIENNTISGNNQGGIFLYRNCGEQPNNPNQVLRTQPATGNVIRDNVIEGGSLVGIAIASRQDMPVKPESCRLRVDAARGIYPDAAPGNRVLGNTIRGVPVGIRVSDDGNVVEDNRISAARDCIRLGSQARNRLGHPIQDLIVRGNSCMEGRVNVLPETRMIQGNGPMTR